MGLCYIEDGEQAGNYDPKAPYSHHNDRYPSLSWGHMLYAVRWHFNRMKQAEMAKMLGTKQEYISRWELGKAKVPETVRSWILAQLLAKLPDAAKLPPMLPANYPMPSRHQRQRQLMEQHGTFGGKGKPRKSIEKAA